MLAFEDIPTVKEGEICTGPAKPGEIWVTKVMPMEQYPILIKYLVLALSESLTAVSICRDYEVVFAEEDGILHLHGKREDIDQAMVGMWRCPELRPFFDALHLQVHDPAKAQPTP